MEELAARFEALRPRLRGMAWRMLGSWGEADDAVQEAWVRLCRAEPGAIEDLAGWLTPTVARICLDALRARRIRSEAVEVHVPDPLVTPEDVPDPEREAILADAVGMALHVVLNRLGPAERIAFVLHDVFGFPFGEIGAIVGRSPEAARQLASRGRRRVREAAPSPDDPLPRQREVVNAFFAAAHAGDLEGLLAILDPDVRLRADGGAKRADATASVRGAAEVARRVLRSAQPDAGIHPVLVNGAAGVVTTRDGNLFTIMAFTVAGGRIRAIDVLADPDRIARLELPSLSR